MATMGDSSGGGGGSGTSAVLLLHGIDDVQRAVDAMYQQLSGRLHAMHAALRMQLHDLEQQLLDGGSSCSNNSQVMGACASMQATYKSVMPAATSPMTSGTRAGHTAAMLAQQITADALRTPMRPSLLSLRNDEMHAYTPAACSPSPLEASARSGHHGAAAAAAAAAAMAAPGGDVYDTRLQQQQQRAMMMLQSSSSSSQLRGRGDSTPLQTREQTLPPAPTPTHIFASRALASHTAAAAAVAAHGITSPASLMATPSSASHATAATTTTSTSAMLPGERQRAPCNVLVAFKRNRVLRYRAPYYVAPGEYVVVGGDRGEDIGVVTRSWYEGGGEGGGSSSNNTSTTSSHPHATSANDEQGGSQHTFGVASAAGHGSAGQSPTPPVASASASSRLGEHAWVDGVGEVLRVATPLEVTQLQGVQSELEKRAVEVAQEKVQEHALPMRIVEAEYQFDRRKLTFYYQSQHRLDFRNLVRDLYKTFRARIWMEADTTTTST